MQKEYVPLVLGIWVAILPYLGFPSSWKAILFTLTGIILIYFSYTLYIGTKMKQKKRSRNFENFSENNFPEKDAGNGASEVNIEETIELTEVQE